MVEYSAWIRRLKVQVILGRDIACVQIYDTFSGISVRESKITAFAHAQLLFYMLTL